MVKKITKNTILELFINNYEKSYYLRELAVLIGKPHQSIKPYIEELASKHILIEAKRKNILEYSLNFKNKQIINYLSVSENERLLEKLNKDVLLRTLFEKLSSDFKDNIFIVFGSSVKDAKKSSDIDLLVVGKSDINKKIKDFHDVYNKKIHKLQVDSLKELDITLVREIYKKHIILNKNEDVLRFLGELYEKNKLV